MFFKLHRPKSLVTSFVGLAISGLTMFCLTIPAHADVTTYDIGISDTSSEGNTLSVFGMIELDVDIVDTSMAIQSSILFIQRNNETPIELTNFENSGGPQIDFIESVGELFVKGLGQDNEYFRWDGNGSETFIFGSGPGNDSAIARYDETELWVQDNSQGNGVRLGSVSSVPEPGSLTVCLALAGIAAIRRRRRIG